MPTDEPQDDVVSRARAALDGITPGPWVYSDIIGTDHNVSIDGWDIARCTEGGARTPDEAEANATFIAAAPDLVRDLVAEVEWLRSENHVLRQGPHVSARIGGVMWHPFKINRCPHAYIRGIYGDEINQSAGYRLVCRDCGLLLDGPVSLARALDGEADRA